MYKTEHVVELSNGDTDLEVGCATFCKRLINIWPNISVILPFSLSSPLTALV